ncbi:DUF6946 family protein [Desulforhopalus vacuolatus]|uniref:DUF6946 family protein n=1 Tax=Desulforhopalus vacuolatus TaxID=40414 RepID=UPI003F6B0308
MEIKKDHCINKILVPARKPDNWKQFLASPDKQWKTGYSARSPNNDINLYFAWVKGEARFLES